MSRLIRVLPRRTKATPNDALAYFGPPDRFAEADAIHVSVAFTWDKPAAEKLAEQWRVVAPTQLGGAAYGDPGGESVPGRYIKLGYGFTSRGCPRRCWFCSLWKRDPTPRLLPIVDCWNILDDNLLACPRPHVEAVFAMLRRQGRQVEFTGGLEALALEDYQVDLLAGLRPRPSMFFAYDPGDAFEARRVRHYEHRRGAFRLWVVIAVLRVGLIAWTRWDEIQTFYLAGCQLNDIAEATPPSARMHHDAPNDDGWVKAPPLEPGDPPCTALGPELHARRSASYRCAGRNRARRSAAVMAVLPIGSRPMKRRPVT
jgi:hypothetical protein